MNTPASRIPTPRPDPLVWIAEDDDDDRMLIAEALRDVGVDHAVHFARDGAELIEQLRGARQLPDLILLDLNMPRMSGQAALECMRGDVQMRVVPVVVLTTSGTESDIRSAYAAGANSYLRKPRSFHGLVALIRRLREYWFETVSLPGRH
ncbi:MAG: response regulator [Lysobacterales bacterium]